MSPPSKPYCGGKHSPPRGRATATSATQCSRQVRAFGRRVVRDDPPRTAAAAKAATWGGERCGRKNSPNAVQGNCGRQHRLYGLLPILETRSDLRRVSSLVNTKEDHETLPLVEFEKDHPYTVHAYEGINGPVSKVSLGTLFCSVVWAGAPNVAAAAREPQSAPDGVGFGFGYFLRAKRTSNRLLHFHIVHVHVNRPYRRGREGGAHVSSFVVEEFVAAIKHRARTLGAQQVTITIDKEAPCFQLGNREYMTDKRSQTLESMYTRAGFEVVPMPHEGKRGEYRRRVELVEAL